jgi:FixJ family two-component response regulator
VAAIVAVTCVTSELRRCNMNANQMPVTFTADNADVRMAMEFQLKPFAKNVLLETIRCAIERSRRVLSREATIEVLRHRYSSLSARERAVMALLVEGRLNKHVGAALGISEITVKAHRGRLMRKMGAGCFPELVTMAMRLEPGPAQMDEEVLRSRYFFLTLRERQVMALVIAGHRNKHAAHELGITETTVKIHRGKVMRKMRARSLADLVRFAARLNHAMPWAAVDGLRT